MKTILHIVKRDFGQLWPLVALTTAAQVANASAWIALGHFKEPDLLFTVAQALPFAVYLAIVGLITTLVHQDVIPGAGHDWLVRPIRRRDLMAAKLAFVVLAVHFPMFLLDIVHGAAAGAPVRESLLAAVIHNGIILLVLDLPAAALASITETLTQVITSLLGIWLMVLACIVAGVVLRRGTAPPFVSSGMQWMTPAFWSMVAGAAAMAIIPLQYLRRATKHARGIALAAVLVAPMASYSTWKSAFAIQQSLSPNLRAAGSVSVMFEPGAGPSPDSAQIPGGASLPLLVTGLQPESLLLIDRAGIRVTDENGKVLFAGRTMPGVSGNNQVLATTSSGTDAHTHQRIKLPGAVFDAVKGKTVRIAMEYSLSLFNLDASATLGAMDASQHSRGFGWCKTKIDEEGDDIDLGCLQAGPAPTCASVVLENPIDGLRNPVDIRCIPDYAPFAAQVFPDSISHWGGAIQFRDLHGLTKFPVDGSQISNARLVLKSYWPIAHFTRQLVIPRLRPNDWIAASVRLK
ncbi:MAG: hypothetical protein ACRD25_09540 [Terracidiphilus sp.]